MRISCVILAKNEEKNIADSINSVIWCDEVIVIDDCSKDKTVQIAKKFGVRIFKYSLDDDFSSQRNFGIERAKGDWVLFIDADERVTEELKNEIQSVISSQILLEQKLRGFYIRRADIFFGKKLAYGETGNIKLLRLGEKNYGKWEGNVHERWRIEGSIGELKNPLLHYPHPTINDFLKKINFYTTLRAQGLHAEGKRVNWVSILAYPLGKFVLNFVIKFGFIDGVAGLIFSTMMSFHSFLVRSKLWILTNKK